MPRLFNLNHPENEGGVYSFNEGNDDGVYSSFPLHEASQSKPPLCNNPLSTYS